MTSTGNYINCPHWFHFSRYDVIVDVAPEIKWVPENAYKNLKVVVEIDSDIDANRATEQELWRRHKSIGTLKVVTERGLQVTHFKLRKLITFTVSCFFSFKNLLFTENAIYLKLEELFYW